MKQFLSEKSSVGSFLKHPMLKILRAVISVFLLALLLTQVGRAEIPPAVIRIGAPAYSGSIQTVWGAVGIARAHQLLEQEFSKDGVRFEFPGFKGGGPAVGQALANDQIDFSGNGDFIDYRTFFRYAYAIDPPCQQDGKRLSGSTNKLTYSISSRLTR